MRLAGGVRKSERRLRFGCPVERERLGGEADFGVGENEKDLPTRMIRGAYYSLAALGTEGPDESRDECDT
jgi:hypothetical protein